jgi:hypothetical protein
MTEDRSNILNTWVEVIDASQLKQEVRDINKLPANGLVIKKIHKSDLTITYERMEGGLAGYLDKKFGSCPNIPSFLSMARQKFC